MESGVGLTAKAAVGTRVGPPRVYTLGAGVSAEVCTYIHGVEVFRLVSLDTVEEDGLFVHVYDYAIDDEWHERLATAIEGSLAVEEVLRAAGRLPTQFEEVGGVDYDGA